MNNKTHNPIRLVLVTFPKNHEYNKFIKELLQAKLAAGINVVPVNSLYWWRGRVEESEEVLLIIKTSEKTVEELKDFIIRNHPYEVPQIIVLSPDDVYKPYLEWVLENTSPERKR